MILFQNKYHIIRIMLNRIKDKNKVIKLLRKIL